MTDTHHTNSLHGQGNVQKVVTPEMRQQSTEDHQNQTDVDNLVTSQMRQNHNKAKRRKLMTKTTGILRDIMNKIYEVPEETLLKRNGNMRFKTKNTWWIEYKELNPLLESDPQLREDVIDGIRLANVINR